MGNRTVEYRPELHPATCCYCKEGFVSVMFVKSRSYFDGNLVFSL